MASASFEFQPGKMQDALEYVSECFKWLAVEDNRLFRVAHELHLDKVLETTKNLIHDICYTQNRLAPINRLPPELLGTIFELLTGPRPRLIFDTEYEEPGWHQVQLVCRHWRYTAINTPALWSYVHVSNIHSELLESECAFASASLVRSGVVPLDVYLRGNCRDEIIARSLLEGLRLNSGRIRELRIDINEITHLDSLVQEASQLETLAIHYPQGGADDEYHGSIENWRTPQLRTLFATKFTGWQRGRFSTLRHLILNQQQLDPHALHGLHALLSLNPRLEDLVLFCNDLMEDSQKPLLELPSLDMPCLKRIYVDTLYDPQEDRTAAQLIEKKLLLGEGHAMVSEFSYNPPPEGYFAPLRNLFLHKSARSIHTGTVTTDGQTSSYLRGPVESFLQQCVDAARSRPLEVRELWLWSNSPPLIRGMQVRPAHRTWITGLQAMAEVEKLVLLYDIQTWLYFISQRHLFPSLTELQLHSQEHNHEAAIIRFLEERAQSNPIQVLRFVQDPGVGGQVEAWSQWQESISKFLQFAGRVVFEDPNDRPLRIELPTVCTTESTVHSYWPSWESTMYAYVDIKGGQ
ncbi:hypothetical protein BC835DRAFT_1400355 [Cytidiella melzeri]|nr:hypothetical protein BC835DRAFT_1400355 [Cytidiella melzeri]